MVDGKSWWYMTLALSPSNMADHAGRHAEMTLDGWVVVDGATFSYAAGPASYVTYRKLSRTAPTDPTTGSIGGTITQGA